MLSQGRYWKASRSRSGVLLEVLKGDLAEDLQELRELRIDVPLERWNSVVRHARTDRKLLGGVLMRFANHKERITTVVARDPLLAELQRVVLDASVALIEEATLALSPVEGSKE